MEIIISVFPFSLLYLSSLILIFERLFGTDQTVRVADRLRVQLSLHREALQTQGGLFHDSALLSEAHGLFLDLQLAVQKDLFFLVLDDEARLADSVAVGVSLALLIA